MNVCTAVRRSMWRLGLIAALATVWLLAGVAVAWAEPTLSALAPDPVAGVGPAVRLDTVSIRLNAVDTVDIVSATLKLDGVSQTPALERYAGRWESDGYDSWFVPDNTKANVVFKPATIAVGTHTVMVTVTNASGQTSTASWSFTVAPAQTAFSAIAPAPGATTDRWDAPVSAVIVDPVGVTNGSVTVAIDGAAHPVTLQYAMGTSRVDYDTWLAWTYEGPTGPIDMTDALASFTPAYLPDGPHTAAVTGTNGTGRTFSRTWSFTVAAPPKVMQPQPANGSSVATQAPTISAMIEDNGTIASMEMLVDGARVPAIYDATTKVLSYTPIEALANDRVHSVHVEATDAGGLKGSADWSFTVQVYADMPVSSVCEDCHDPQTHPMNNCDRCHTVVPIGHGLPYQPVSSCRQCHGIVSHGPKVIIPGVTWGGGDVPQPGYTGYWGNYCTYCHQAKYPTIPRHPDDNASFHNTSMDMSSCAPCHVKSLTREHFRYKDAAGAALTCAACHGASAPTKVKTAIAAKNTSCDACHDFASGAAHEALHAPAGLDARCTSCHKDSLTQEHMNNPATQSRALTCATCHNSSDGQVRWAIFSADKKCSACHRAGHNLAMIPGATGVPLYDGFLWSPPIDTAIFAGESWVPAEFAAGGKVVVSNRRSDVTGDQVWTYYRGALTAAGWTVATAPPAPGSDLYSVTFKKGAHVALLWYYGGETHASGPVVSTGHRIEVLYK